MKNILVTRQAEQSIDLINLLSKNAFYPYLLPMIETIGLNFNTKKQVYDYIIFSSTNAVKYFYEKAQVKAIKYIAVGAKTAEFLLNYGINAQIPDNEFSADGLIKYFTNIDVNCANILIPTAKIHSNKLKNFLISKGALVETAIVYKTNKVKFSQNYVNNFLSEYKIDTVIFASPSAAESFFSNVTIDKSIYNLNYISIGKTTYSFLKENYNIESIYPKEYTVEGIVKLLKDFRRKI